MKIHVVYDDVDTEKTKKMLSLLKEVAEKFQELHSKIDILKLFIFSEQIVDGKEADKIVRKNINVISGSNYSFNKTFSIQVIYSSDRIKGIAIIYEKFYEETEQKRKYLFYHELSHLHLNHDEAFSVPSNLSRIFPKYYMEIGKFIGNVSKDYNVNRFLSEKYPEIYIIEILSFVDKLSVVIDKVNKEDKINRLFNSIIRLMLLKSHYYNYNNIVEEQDDIKYKIGSKMNEFRLITCDVKKSLKTFPSEWITEDNLITPYVLCERLCQIWSYSH